MPDFMSDSHGGRL